MLEGCVMDRVDKMKEGNIRIEGIGDGVKMADGGE